MASDESTSDDGRTDCTYYRPQFATVENDGTIIMRGSWWEGETHNTGTIEIPVDAKDYGLWRWILSHRDRFNAAINDLEVELLRQEYEADQNGGQN